MPAIKTKHRKQRYVKIYYKEPSKILPKGRYWLAKIIDAKKPVKINGTFEDAMAGAPGLTIGCHLSVCTMRNKDAFPHPVLFAAYTQSRCDIISEFVERTKKRPYDCIAYRYTHPYGQWVTLNDEDEQKEWIQKNPEKAERPFTLGIVYPKSRQIVENTEPAEDSGTSGFRKSFVPRGALRRALAAKLISKPVADMLEKM